MYVNQKYYSTTYYRIEDDHEIARELEQVDISGAKEKCVIQ